MVEEKDGWNLKRWWTRISAILVMLLLIELLSTHFRGDDAYVSASIAFLLMLWSAIYFALIIFAIPFLTAHHARPTPIWMMTVTIVSISLTILSYSLTYRHFGIIGPDNTLLKVGDYLYFSAVTFSTLGYGDFRPAADARLFAAFQAILGNLHLGMTVGVLFYAISGKNAGNHPNSSDAE